MIVEAIEKILDLVEVQKILIGGRSYTNRNVFPIREPEPGTFSLHTLNGFMDYIKTNVDVLPYDKLLVHVYDPQNVFLVSSLRGPFLQRIKYVQAEHDFKAFEFGYFMPVESFIVALQTQFVQDEVTASILKLVGNLKDEDVRTLEDDEVTQNVTARTSIARVGNVDVPNPVTLRPYRTFREIEQPASKFVFRLKKGTELPQCALFEAEGDLWKLTAINSIRNFLQKEMEGINIAIIA